MASPPKNNTSTLKLNVPKAIVNNTNIDTSDASQLSNSSESSLCPPAITNKGFTIGKQIGSGAFSTIYSAKWTQLGDRPIACKRIEIENVSEAWREKCMKMEMKIIKKLQHPHVIRVHDLIKTRRFVFIFMDLAEKGSIYHIMHNQKQNPKKEGISEKQTKIWFSQIIGALKYCHDKGIAHRDIKLDNFLVNADGNAILTDFGFACLTRDKGSDALMKMTDCGTPEYKAPEIHTPPYDAKSADCYAMGVCLFEMLNFDKPFSEEISQNKDRMIRAQMMRDYHFRKSVESKISKYVKDLINKLLDPNSGTRITSAKVLHNQWLLMPI